HLEQPLAWPHEHVRRQATDLRRLAAFRNDLDVAAALAYQHASVGQERKTERPGESLGDGFDDEVGRPGGMRRARLAEPFGKRRVAVGRGAARGRRPGRRHGRARRRRDRRLRGVDRKTQDTRRKTQGLRSIHGRHRTAYVTVRAMARLTVVAFLMLAQAGGVRNDLPQPYKTTRDWGALPAGMKWAAVTAVEPSPDGSIYVVHRCFANSCAGRSEPPILKYDASGKLLKTW